MKNALWGNENGFALTDNLLVTPLVAAGERMSIVCCERDLCTLALPIAAAALAEKSQREEGREWFSSPPCARGPLWWQQVGMRPRMSGLHFHHCRYHGFVAQLDLGPTAPLLELSSYTSLVKGVLLKRVVIGTGLSQEGKGM